MSRVGCEPCAVRVCCVCARRACAGWSLALKLELVGFHPPLCTVQASWRVCCGMTWTPAAPWSSLGPTSGGRRPSQPRRLVVEVDVQGLAIVVGEGASGPRARAVRGLVLPMARHGVQQVWRVPRCRFPYPIITGTAAVSLALVVVMA